MEDMPRPKLPHLYREVSRHGTVRWVVRVGHAPRVALKAPYGTPAFLSEYHAAMFGTPATDTRRPGAGTLKWLWDRYRETMVWSALSNATRRQRENIMRKVLAEAGDMPLSELTRKMIVEGRDRRASTPAMARHFVDTMRGLFEWAVDAEHVKDDPTHAVKVGKPETEGFAVWSDEDIAKFQTFYALGTRERLAFDILFYTGLRRGDAVKIGRQHVKGGVLTIRTAKTGETVSIRILPELAKSIAGGPCGELTFIVGERSHKPMTKEGFGNWFREVCTKAGCSGSAHGLRKSLATRLANEGATTHELEALFGWRGGGMASLYTRKANRIKLAGSAIDRFVSGTPAEQTSPNPQGKLGNAV